jgi:hypothetical protein
MSADILSLIDQEIAHLQQARSLLKSINQSSVSVRRGPGRPKKNLAGPTAAKPKKKRRLSPEARAKIVAAVKRRWAAQRAAAKK